MFRPDARRQESLTDPAGAVSNDPGSPAAETSFSVERHLTGREVEVLCLIAAGYSSEQAAERLMLSPHTIIRHVTHMMMRSGARSRTELVARAYVSGVLDNGVWPPRPGVLSQP